MVTRITNHTRTNGPYDKIFSTVDVIVNGIPTIRFWFDHKSSAKQAADSLAKACSMDYTPEAYHKAAGTVNNNIPDIRHPDL